MARIEVSVKRGGPAFVGRALAVWALIAAAETVHGVLRGLLVVPMLGETTAQRLGFVVGSVIVLGIAWATSPWLDAGTRSRQALAGVLWAGLMAGFEVLVGQARGFDAARMAAEFDPSRGGLMGFGLLLVLLAPAVGARLHAGSGG